MKSERERNVLKLRRSLLFRKKWAFLRYWHTRNAMKRMKDCESFCFVGAGYALAEIALAVEYPDRHFLLTDHLAASHNFKRAQALVDEYGLKNVEFGMLDILSPVAPPKSFDAVCSVEVLEHIEAAELAAKQMNVLAKKKIFCLVPFATAQDNADAAKRKQAWDRHEHHVVGFDAPTLRKLFPGSGDIYGVYWEAAGQELRKFLDTASPAEIEAREQDCIALAIKDSRTEEPTSDTASMGVYTVARAV